jgi:cysteine-rich repeat protein
VELYTFRRNAGLLALLVIPVVCLSMGGCPPQGGDAVCGNGSVESGEECDDGNTTAGDGCSASCQDEGSGTCGDGTVDAGEECDDGNTVDGDDCSSTCENEGSTPVDSDGDGVRDEIDECPGTTRGTEVDAVGCPEDAPVDDPDDDGVVGDADDCPNTPAGAPVDENGCASNQLDSDGDGVTDNIDACERTPETVEVDEEGCPVSTDPTDDDEDGVPNDIDQCEDTPADAEVDANGCSAAQRDSDDDGINDDVDECPTQAGNAPTGCPGGGGGAVCGNGAIEAGEQCDDNNTASGDGCSSTCQLEASGIANDDCADAEAIGEGSEVFSNVGATTDGPLELEDCNFFGRSDIRSDLWYCYTATCGGPVVVSLCGSGYDTKMAVYFGCECPSPDQAIDRPIGCSDDDCGSGTENAQSRVTITAVAGQSYLVRVGGFFGNREQGEGRLTIRCGGDTCANGVGSCTTGHADDEPGCETASCCERVCDVDTFCCDVTWDAFCASQAEGFCSTTGFPSCNAEAGGCDVDQTSPGCNNAECCNAVCETDPFCCIREWDENCVAQSDLICESCGRGRGECNEARTTPGCNDIACCAQVCALDDFCCNSEWDVECVRQAGEVCGR